MHCLQLKKKKKYPHIVLDIAFLQLIDLVQSCQNRPLNFYYAFGRVGFSINLCDYVDVLQCLWQHHLYSHILPIDILNNILHICALLINACLHHCDCRIFSYIPCTEENQAPTSENNSCFDFSLLRRVYKIISSQSCNLFPLLRTLTGRSTQRREHPKEGAPTRGNSFQRRKTWIHILKYYQSLIFSSPQHLRSRLLWTFLLWATSLGNLGKGIFTLETEEALLATVLLLLVSPHLCPG